MEMCAGLANKIFVHYKNGIQEHKSKSQKELETREPNSYGENREDSPFLCSHSNSLFSLGTNLPCSPPALFSYPGQIYTAHFILYFHLVCPLVLAPVIYF